MTHNFSKQSADKIDVELILNEVKDLLLNHVKSKNKTDKSALYCKKDKSGYRLKG